MCLLCTCEICTYTYNEIPLVPGGLATGLGLLRCFLGFRVQPPLAVVQGFERLLLVNIINGIVVVVAAISMMVSVYFKTTFQTIINISFFGIRKVTHAILSKRRMI